MRFSTTAVAAALGATALLASMAGTAGATTVTDSMVGGGGKHRVYLDGQQEVPGPGDPDGRGRFQYEIKHDKLCYKLSVRNIETPTAAHIHFGPEGEAGPIAVALKTPPADGSSHGCIRAQANQTPENAAEVLTRWELDGIKKSPFFFYVNVHNEEFPAGAIRGQL